MNDELVWNTVTFGIPLLGVLGCLLGGRSLLRLVRQRTIRPLVAVLLCVVIAGAPWLLAEGAFRWGSYLAAEYDLHLLSGERALGLFFLMAYYTFFAFFFFAGFLWKLNAQGGGLPHLRRHRHTRA